MKTMKMAAAAIAIGIGLSATTATAASAHGPAQRRSIAEILLADSREDDANGFDKNNYDYDIVTQAVLAFPDLVAAASDPNAALTVFVPNDLAFKLLVKDLAGSQPATEKETFDAVVGLGLDTVKTVLTYHIVPGAKVSFKAAREANGATITTLQGGTFQLKIANWGGLGLIDQDPNARNGAVVEGNLRGEGTNGYVHGVDRVLRPIDL
jgi:uncharacterized surface protein with fasciclin (FAS1) repeats